MSAFLICQNVNMAANGKTNSVLCPLVSKACERVIVILGGLTQDVWWRRQAATHHLQDTLELICRWFNVPGYMTPLQTSPDRCNSCLVPACAISSTRGSMTNIGPLLDFFVIITSISRAPCLRDQARTHVTIKRT